MDNIISLDESSIDSHILDNYGWSNKGKQIIKTITEPRKRYTIITAISCKKIIHNKTIKGSANGEKFIISLWITYEKIIKKDMREN